MEWTQLVLPAFVALEILIILALYRYILRDWIIEKWEAKMDEEGWLVIRFEPVIDEIEERMHDKLQAFQDSCFGYVGKKTANAKNLEPMNKIRKAAKDNDWTSFMVEYVANKAGLGGLLGHINPQTAEKELQTKTSDTLMKGIKGLK